MFIKKITEEEKEIKKRERWLNINIKKEKIIEHIKDFFYNTYSLLKFITRKKTPEQKELIKREKWLNRTRKIEDIKIKITEIFNKSKEKKEEKKIKKSEEFAKKFWEASTNRQKEIEQAKGEIDLENFDINDFEGLIAEFDDKRDEDISIIEENRKIKAEIIKNKKLETTNKNSIKNLKIAKITLGTILTSSSSIILAKHNLPINIIEGVTIASGLNIGIYTVMNGLLIKEKETSKVKVFKDLTNIGE